jgi:hypothetical protein
VSFHQELSETIEKGLRKRGIFLYGSSVKGTWEGGSLTGNPEDYVEDGSGDGHRSRWGLCGRHGEGSCLQATWRHRVKGL